jgi:hypothetical protein
MNNASTLRAQTLRDQIEAALADRIPSALTPPPRRIRPVAETGIPSLDALLEGGLPLGAITEVVGPECSGRTSLALSFVAAMTQAGKVCAWIDVSNVFDPESAAAIGVQLNWLLWVRCGITHPPTPPTPTNRFLLSDKYLVPAPTIKGLHGGGHGPHPRNEVKGLSEAVGGFLHAENTPRTPSPLPGTSNPFEMSQPLQHPTELSAARSRQNPKKPWARLDQALRVTDLLLQAGGFSAIVLDMGSVTPQDASRVPLATWFRYRAAAERTQASILLLTQHPCAKSSVGLLLRLHPGRPLEQETTLFTGIEHRIEISRERFAALQPRPAHSNVIPLRKPVQSEHGAHWTSHTTWASASARTGSG